MITYPQHNITDAIRQTTYLLQKIYSAMSDTPTQIIIICFGLNSFNGTMPNLICFVKFCIVYSQFAKKISHLKPN